MKIFIFLAIIIVVMCFFTYFSLQKISKVNGKLKYKGSLKICKLFEYNFEIEHDNNN